MAEFFHFRRDDRSEAVLKARAKHGRGMSEAFRDLVDRYDRMCKTPLRWYKWMASEWVVEIARIVAKEDVSVWAEVFDAKFPERDYKATEKAKRESARKVLAEAAARPAVGFALIDAVKQAHAEIGRLGSNNLTADQQHDLIVSYLKGD